MNIRSIIHLFLFPLLFILNQHISAQNPDPKVIDQLNTYFDQTYGLDQKLISGVQYYSKYPRSLGNEFLCDGEFTTGRLIMDGTEYNNVNIRYDIYNQRINLQFHYDSSAANIVIIESYKIDEFEINGMLFRKNNFPGYDTLFFQIVAEGRISCLYYWYKNLTLQTSMRNIYEFSEPRRKSFLLIDSTLSRYNGKQEFIKLFSENKSDVRKYLRLNQIRLRHASDPVIARLINYCNSLGSPGNKE